MHLNMKLPTPHGHRGHNGFTLLEVLVALAVLSLGLLGLAGLQTLGLRFNHESYQRTQATVLAYDIIDRMRANRSALSTYINSGAVLGNKPGTTDCATTACSALQLAEFDIRRWNEMNERVLSEGKGKIDVSGLIYTITIEWKEKDSTMTQRISVQI